MVTSSFLRGLCGYIDFVKFNADIARSLEANTSHDLDGSVSYYFESLASILNKTCP